MKIFIRIRQNVVTAEISGIVDSHAGGRIYDTLVQCVGNRNRKLIVDLSGVQTMTRAGMRGLVVAARLMKSNCGDMRICGAQKSIEAGILNLGYNHLLNIDPTHQIAIEKLHETVEQKSRSTAKVIKFSKTNSAHPEDQCPVEREYYRRNPTIWKWELS